MKIEHNSCVIVKFNAILGYWRFMQIRQRIFNCTENYAFHSRQNSETFDILHAFLSSVVAKLSDLKNSPVFFGPPCMWIWIANKLAKFHAKRFNQKTLSDLRRRNSSIYVHTVQRVQGGRIADGAEWQAAPAEWQAAPAWEKDRTYVRFYFAANWLMMLIIISIIIYLLIMKSKHMVIMRMMVMMTTTTTRRRLRRRRRRRRRQWWWRRLRRRQRRRWWRGRRLRRRRRRRQWWWRRRRRRQLDCAHREQTHAKASNVNRKWSVIRMRMSAGSLPKCWFITLSASVISLSVVYEKC